MTIADPVEPLQIIWNGQPEERARAKLAFDEAMATGYFMAVASPVGGGALEQIREFDPEAAEITVSPALSGG